MTEPISPPPINTTKMARDMTPAEQAAFFAQCKKLESAPSQSTPPDTLSARNMSEQEREEWWREHKRRWK
jgi:hypothetical protein